MNNTTSWREFRLTRLRISPVSLTALASVVLGVALAATVHKGFMILMSIGAFGPGVLRQFGLLDDLDEFQQSAAAKAGLRAYLVGSLILMAVVVAGGWNQLSLSNDQVPASAIVTIMLVVYYASYCLCFWDVRRAVSRVLLAFGIMWLAFSVASTGGDLKSLFTVGLVVPAPFILGALLCHRWPFVTGFVLLGASVWSLFFFHLIPLSEIDPQRLFTHLFTIALITLPLAVTGSALVSSGRDNLSDHNTPQNNRDPNGE